VLGDQDEDGLAETGAKLKACSAEVITCPLDVTSDLQCKAFIDAALSGFGRLDFLILCAGISMWARFDQVRDLAVFRQLVEVNYLGAVYCIHAALPSLRQNRGTIVAVSSLQGVQGIPNHTGYSASKHALTGFLDALELELGDQVRILNVMPGWITGTGLRSRAFTADGAGGGVVRKHSRESVTVEECAERIIDAMQERTGLFFIPPKLKFLPLLKAFAPGLVRTIVKRAVNKQET
jgi:NAD(P)-dependent dehydrogenase (short-subunit alcohol dehydrogenase family)